MKVKDTFTIQERTAVPDEAHSSIGNGNSVRNKKRSKLNKRKAKNALIRLLDQHRQELLASGYIPPKADQMDRINQIIAGEI